MLESDKHCTAIDFQTFKKQFESLKIVNPTPSHEDQRQLDRAAHATHNSNFKKKNTLVKGKPSGKIITGGQKRLGLPQVLEENESPGFLITRNESPWDTYRRTLRCQIAGEVFIAARRSRPSQVVAIREYTGGNVEKMLRLYGRLDHSNLLSARECFVDGGSMYALVDDLPLNLEHLVGCRLLYPTEGELASMVWQILEGLCYLCNLKLEHRSLGCRSILLGLDGVIKIGCLEACVGDSSNQLQRLYIKVLASITMELMQKYAKDDDIVGVDDLNRWPVDSNAFGFLSALSTTDSLESLKLQALVHKKHRLVGELVLLARSVLLSAKMFHSYEK